MNRLVFGSAIADRLSVHHSRFDVCQYLEDSKESCILFFGHANRSAAWVVLQPYSATTSLAVATESGLHRTGRKLADFFGHSRHSTFFEIEAIFGKSFRADRRAARTDHLDFVPRRGVA